jgi:LysM repeat protein
MKILQIFGAVVAIHLLAFIFIFASPGCQSGPHNPPTPDATMPVAGAAAPSAYNGSSVTPQPVDLGTPAVMYNPASPSGHAAPTRPGSADAVAITPAKPVENVAPVSTYTVERGDSLWSIAKKHGLTVSELAKANSVTTGTALKPGRKLIIPGKAGVASAASAPAAPAETAATPAAHASGAEAVKHTVQSGESLGVIARKYGVTVGELAAANNITDPSKVRVGQQLVIPGAKAGAKSSTASSKPASSTKAASAAAKPAAAPAPTEAAKPAEAAPHFELTPPPPGQDLDAGLKDAPPTDVPTIKVEEPAPATPPAN